MENIELVQNTKTTKINKVQLKGLTLTELQEYFRENGQPKFRGAQVFNWMYNHLAADFTGMENLPKALRNELNEKTDIQTLQLVDSETSPESGTKKFIFQTKEGNKIESVIIPESIEDDDEYEKKGKRRTTLCISTQVGCPLDCQFCATGLMGYKKNLTAGEIFDQYMLAAKDFGKENITNIVYMGMGEPLLNFNATLKTLNIFGEELTTGISLKKITVSTAGIAPKIKELADTGIKVKLALSLHSCFNDIRNKIMPINKKYPLEEVLDACRYYAAKTGTRITFEYIMLKNVNDRQEDINALVRLCSTIPSKINIIPFNSLAHMNPSGFAAELIPTPAKRIKEFVQKLRDRNLTVMVRDTLGEDIAAACGQLAVKYENAVHRSRK